MLHISVKLTCSNFNGELRTCGGATCCGAAVEGEGVVAAVEREGVGAAVRCVGDLQRRGLGVAVTLRAAMETGEGWRR